ncbi:SpoIIE family protein phosphatase [Streptomyces sp. NPDC000410]|uniref:SpoIIE family protein phosphatase n=1 Tax=Streptomyces sp. NPDC000410 TaxID=3154254 RepID=UPI00331B3AC5
MVDARGVVTEWSPEAERLLGHPADQVLGRPAAQLLAGAHEVAEAASAAPAPDGAAVLVRHRDGHLLPCRLAIRPEAASGTRTRWEVLLAPADTAPPQPELDRALLEALFTQSPVGLFLLDPGLRLVRFNAAGEGMHGVSPTEALGKRPSEAWPGFSADVAERVMGQVLASGLPVLRFEKRGRPPGDPGREHVYSGSAFRLEDDDGRVLGVAEAVVDVTDLHLARERLALLAEGGARIGSTLDVMRTAQELAEVAVERLADSVAIEVLEPVLAGEDLSPGPVPPGTVLRRAASGSRRRDGPPGAIEVGEVSTYPQAAPASAVLADLRPRLVGSLRADSDWVTRDPVRGPRMLDERVHSLMVVPLVAQDRALGLVTFYRWGEGGAFRQDDLTLAAELTRRTAVCLDNAHRYLRERNALVALQRSLLPGELPHHHGMEVAHEYVHAGAGGDWVDVIPLSGARLALVAGSVPGRGIRTAAAMGRLRAAVHTLSDLDLEPDELLARLDDLVRRLDAGDRPEGTGTPSSGGEAGATCLYLVYDPVSQRCSLASAGHPGPAVAHPDGTASILDVPTAAALGRPGPPFGKAETVLPENSTLALYTPGLLQARPDAAAGALLPDLLARAPGSVREACRMLSEALLPADPGDDAAVLVARTHALGPGRVASWDLPSDPAVVSTARSLVTRQLALWALDEASFATELIASELVTNAIRYAKAPIHLRLIRDQVLTCEVSDGSSTSPRLRHARTTDEGGRGLLLVAQCSERWGTRYTPDGKTIWAEQHVS